MGNKQCNGIVIVSQPGGDIDTENAFLTECTDILKEVLLLLSLIDSSSLFVEPPVF